MVKHGKAAPTASSVVAEVLSNVSFLHLFSIKKNWDINQQLLLKAWCPPPDGCVLRDHKGRMLCAYGKQIIHWDATFLEMKVILSFEHLIEDWVWPNKRIIIECDNVNIMKILQDSLKVSADRKNKAWRVDLSFLEMFKRVIFQFTPRDCNKVADFYSHHANLDYKDPLLEQYEPEANLKVVKEIKSIIDEFCGWTGQKVNVSKSCILFGSSVRRRRRKAIIQIMGFRSVKEFQYLGIKMTLRSFENDQHLGGKLISLAGRITLIKSVLLSYSVFHCTNSLVPKGILDEIDKICRRFVWSKSNGKPGIHYVDWKSMCRPVKRGGRALHSSNDKVGPLRAKLTWRYCQQDDSLLHRVLYPKYGFLFGENLSNNAGSVARKIIHMGVKFLKPIIRWNISNGESIDAFRDTWILDKCLNKWPTLVCPQGSEVYSVDKFISGDSWNKEELNKFFGEDLQALIWQIPINPDLIKDRMELISNNLGKTISALAYEASNSDCQLTHYWNWAGRAKLIPRNFSGCPRDCNGIEDIDHVAVKCQKLREVFKFLNNWGFKIPLFCSLEDCYKWLSFQNMWLNNLYCTAIYFSWKARNKLVFEGKDNSALFIASEVVSYASISASKFYLSSGIWNANQLNKLNNNKWHPPPPDWIKINVDASLLQSYRGGIGGVFCDSKGRFLFAFGHSCIHWDASSLELMAVQVLSGMLKDWMFKYKGAIIEGDNSNVIKFLQQGYARNHFSSADFQFLTKFNNVIFNCIGRGSNKLADLCANYAFFSSFVWEDVSIDKIPPSFIALLKEEYDVFS
ncbi:hypothetical protein M5K25_008367 [Dendrobium thyrsiflorum]|uniref:RNase H type-1 domain-containing protein n=1 Tax=Dendrobium thyrsiflorum TaxID=117978 RepID=A0ABD0V9N7_DENTH